MKMVVTLIFIFITTSSSMGQYFTKVGLWTKGVESGNTFSLAFKNDLIIFDAARSVRLYNISDLTNPIELDSYPVTLVLKIMVYNNLIFVFDRDSPLLFIFKISSENKFILVKKVVFDEKFYQVNRFGDKFLILSNNKLKIYTLSNNMDFELNSSLDIPTKNYSQMYLSNNICAVATHADIYFIHLSPSGEPSLESVYSTGVDAIKNIKIVDNKLYYTGYKKGLGILDISHPDSVILAGNYYLDSTSGLEVSGEYAYVYDVYAHSIKFFNITNPSLPTLVYEYPTEDFYIKYHSNKLYLSNWLKTGISILNISDIYNPFIEQKIIAQETIYYFYQVKIYKDVAYLNCGNRGVLLANANYYTKLNLIRELKDFSFARGVSIDSSYLFVSSDNKMFIYDITTPSIPNLLSNFIVAEPIEAFTPSDGLIYLITYHYFYIFNYLENPQQPQEVFSIKGKFSNTYNHYGGISKVNNQIHISVFDNMYDYIDVYDVTDPSNTYFVSAIRLFKNVRFFNYKSIIYGLFRDSGQLKICDISNLNDIKILKEFNFSSKIYFIYFIGDIGYAFGSSVMKIDFSDPYNPKELGSQILPTENISVDIYNNHIYSCWYKHGVDIYNINKLTDVISESKNDKRSLYLYCYPNPFNITNNITYYIPNNSIVTLKVYDILGSEKETLVNKNQVKGNYTVKFDATDLSSGIYFFRLQAGGYVKTIKTILLK